MPQNKIIFKNLSTVANLVSKCIKIMMFNISKGFFNVMHAKNIPEPCERGGEKGAYILKWPGGALLCTG